MVMMKKLVRKIRAAYKFYKDRRFLKRHGCKTWRSYYIKFDPMVNKRSSMISSYYVGYPFVATYESSNFLAQSHGDWQRGWEAMRRWCDENSIGHWRTDIHRVVKYNNLGITIDDYMLNDLGGLDALFFAFDNKQDYFLFRLKWG